MKRIVRMEVRGTFLKSKQDIRWIKASYFARVTFATSQYERIGDKIVKRRPVHIGKSPADIFIGILSTVNHQNKFFRVFAAENHRITSFHGSDSTESRKYLHCEEVS